MGDNKQLQLQIRQYAEIIARMHTGMYIFHLEDRADDRTFRLIDANEISITALGLARDECVGRTLDEIFPYHRSLGTPAKLVAVIATGTPIYVEDALYEDSRIPKRFFNYQAFALPDDCVCVLWEDITGRKKAELALQQAHESICRSNQEWERTFDSMSDGVALLSTDWEILNINEPFCAMLDKKCTDVIGKKCFETVHGQDRPLPGCPCSEVLKTRKKVEIEIFEPRLKAWLSVSVSPVFNDDGTIAYLIHVVRNITERRQMVEALQESQKRLAQIIDFLPDATFVIDREGVVVAWNRAIEAMTGVKSESIVGKGNYEYSLPFYGARRPILIDLAFSTTEDIERKYHGVKRVGDIVVAEADVPVQGKETRALWGKVIPLYDSKGNPVGAIEAIRDITDMKVIERNLRNRELELQTVVNSAPIPQFVIGTDHRIIYWNKALEEISGIKAEDVIGTNQQWRAFYNEPRPCLADLLIDEAYDNIPKWYRNKYARSEMIKGVYEATDIFPMAGRKVRWLHFSAVAIRDQEGKIVGGVETLEDVTERKEAQDKLAASEEQYRTLVNNLSVGVFRTLPVPGGTFLRANPALAHMLGYESVEEFMKVPTVESYKNPEDRQNFLHALRQYGLIRNKELVFKRKDQTPFWVSISAQAHYNATGEMDWVDGIIEDISGRKEARDKLTASEEQYRTLVNNLNVGVFRSTIDGEGVFFQVNPALVRILGYDTMEELLKVPVGATYYSQDDRVKYLEGLRTYGEVKNREMLFRKKDSTSVWLSVSAQTHRDDNGNILWLDGIVEDVSERKAAQDKLELERTKYKDLAENMSSGVVIYEPRNNGQEFVIREFNRAAEKIEQINRQDVVGKEVAQVFPGVKEFGLYDVFKRVWTTGRPEAFPVGLYKDNRISGWRDNHVYKLPSGEIVAVYDDVTEREKALETIRSERQRLEGILRGTNAGTWEWNIQTGATIVNGRWAEIVGYTLDEISPVSIETWKRFAHPDDLKTSEILLERHFRGDLNYYECEARMKHKNGEWVWVLDRGKVMSWTADGKPLLMMGTHQDITERKKAEQALRESEERYRVTLDQAVDSVIMHDATGRILDVNRKTCQNLGYSREELLSMCIGDIDPKAIQAGKHQLWQEVLSGRQVTFESEQVRKDGTILPVEITLGAVKLQAGPVVQGIVRDITERKKTENQIRQLNLELEERVRQRTAQLEASMKELDAFSYSVSHDLQAPLRAIDGFARIILDEHATTFTDDTKQLFERIRSNIKKMSQLINDLLALSRLDRTKINISVVDMGLLFRQCIEELKPTYEGRAIQFDIKPLPVSSGDPVLLHEVVVNLLANAIKFTRPRPQAVVEIGSYVKDDEPVYYVKDNGVGFDMNYVNKLYKAFMRLHHEREFEGTGIGLSIVNRVVMRHGGKTWAEGEIDKGATISFTLGRALTL